MHLHQIKQQRTLLMYEYKYKLNYRTKLVEIEN